METNLILGVLLFVFGITFWMIAKSDSERRMIPDILSAELWMVLGALSVFAPWIAVSCVIYFGSLLGINVLTASYNKDRYMFSWGDMLVIPPFLAICEGLWGDWGFVLGLSSVGLSSIVSVFVKREVPVSPWLFAMFVILALTRYISI